MNHIQAQKKKRIRNIIVIIAMLLTVVATALGCVFVGSSSLSFREALEALLGAGNNAQSRIIWRIRVPRVLAAVIAGAGLSVHRGGEHLRDGKDHHDDQQIEREAFI